MSPDRRGSSGKDKSTESSRSSQVESQLHGLASGSFSDQLPRIFLLTAVVAVDKLITVALCLADLVALLAVVETGIVLVLVVPRWRWGRFGRAGNGNVASRSYAATSDRSARSIMIVGCAVLSVLRAILVLLGSAIGRVVVFG